jgi:hypothetical protein
MKRLLLAISLMSLLPLSAFANSAGGASPGGTDGCGLGWQVTDKKTWLGTTTRGTTNSFVPPTFGMTSGTIGCDQHPIAKNEVDAAVYAHNNYESLSVEMAQGQGEYVSGLAKVMGCDDAVVPAFGEMTQKNYKQIMSSDKNSALDMYDNVKTQIKNDAVLSAGCNV